VTSEAPTLLDELRRRKVVRVGLAYVMASWALLQVVDVVAPILEISDATVQVLFWLLVAGFPVAVFLAWAFELTPEGIRSTERARREYGEAQHEEAIQKRRNRLAYLSGIIGPAMLIGGGLGAAAVWTFVRPSAEQEAADVSAETLPTIAVLPFRNMSPDPDNAFFAEGVHEEILTRLSRLSAVRVISRTSVMQFTDDLPTIPEIAKMLNATHVVEGSVRRAGGSVRITAQLIDAGTDQHLWAENYDRELADIFEIQDRVASQIASALHTELSPADTAMLSGAYEPDLEAFDLVTKARVISRLSRQGRSREGPDPLTLVRQAVEIDPDYAAAWQLLGQYEAAEVHFGRDPDGEHLAAAEQALDRAQALAPDATDTLLTEALVLYHGKKRYAEALQVIQQAREQEPGRSDFLTVESWILRRLGRQEEMLDRMQEAVALDPFNGRAHLAYARELDGLQRYEEAYRSMRRARDAGVADPWIDFDVRVAGAIAQASYEDYARVMDARLAELSDSDIPIIVPTTTGGSGWNLIEHLLLTDRSEEAWRLIGREPRAIDPSSIRDIMTGYFEVAALEFNNRSQEARALAERTLEAVLGYPDSSNIPFGEILELHKAWLGAYLGRDDLTAEGLSLLRHRVQTVEDELARGRYLYWYLEALAASDPEAAQAAYLAEPRDVIGPHVFATRPHLWHRLLDHPDIRARFDDHPEWVQFMRDRWPESRPFPFDQEET
jgi:TolB-like protein